jgi:hypothetical protein
MVETALVALTLLALVSGSVAFGALAADVLLIGGFWIVAAGLAFGLPTGAVYHLELQRSLSRTGTLPRRWWLHPTSHHRLIPPEDSFRVLAWCGAGALGCGVAFLGCAVIALGAWKAIAGS